MSRRLDFALKRPSVSQAIARGIHFEITYSTALKDTSNRSHLISNAMTLVRATKGKNIIISSEAKVALDIRGPYDIMNLGTLFGMPFDISKRTVSSRCDSALVHGETRKTHKGVLKSAKIRDSTSVASNAAKVEEKVQPTIQAMETDLNEINDEEESIVQFMNESLEVGKRKRT